jgi:hypothetical protein
MSNARKQAVLTMAEIGVAMIYIWFASELYKYLTSTNGPLRSLSHQGHQLPFMVF